MDLFGKENTPPSVKINLYADEVQSKRCPYTNDDWFYIGIIIEPAGSGLLSDIVDVRYCSNYDRASAYYSKNDRIVHWVDVADIDSKNICSRWLDYILDPCRSRKSFYAYVLGLNNAKLNKCEFGDEQEFNRKYNRFFRTAVLYAIKSFFPSGQVVIANIFHEEGQQQHHDYFPWHCVYKLDQVDNRITCTCDKVTFLPKCHRNCPESNIIQLCDLFLGLCTSGLHGIVNSKSSKYKAELLEVFLPLLTRMINEPHNKNSSYEHSNRIMIRNFPRERTDLNDIRRLKNQFFTKRRIRYLEEQSGQTTLF
jgi:hypothetical protein